MSEGPLVRRQPVPPVTHYGEHRDALRVDFWFSCAYCTITEVEAHGLRFTIDHYEPQSARPDLETDYDNLMWSCDHCNELKGDIYPPETARQQGDRFIRPDQDVEADHLELEGLLLRGLTQTGRFSLVMLDLNRASLRQVRDIRRRIDASSRHILRGLTALTAHSIEQLSTHHRGRFLSILADLKRQQEKLALAAEALEARALREMNRSPLLDHDPDAADRAKDRRKLLNEKKALHGDSFRGRTLKRKRSNKR